MDHVVTNRVTPAQAVVPQVMAAMMAQMVVVMVLLLFVRLPWLEMVVVMVDGVMPGSREG